MSHDDHGHEPGGHEIDKMPNARLFNLLVGLTILTLVACIGVIQLFNLQVRGIEDERAARESFRLKAYWDEQNGLRNSFGRVIVTDDDGLQPPPEDPKKRERGKQYGKGPHKATLKRMPMDQAKAMVLKDNKAMRASRAFPGWADPDEQWRKDHGITTAPKGQPQIRKVPPGTPQPGRPGGAAPGRPAPQPRGAVPARPGAQPTGAKPAGNPGAKPEGAKPAGAKPAGAKPAGDKPAGAKPADGAN